MRAYIRSFFSFLAQAIAAETSEMIKAHGLRFVKLSLLLETTALSLSEWQGMFNASIVPIVLLRVQGEFFFEVEASSKILSTSPSLAKDFWERFVAKHGLKRKLSKAQKVKVAARQKWRCMRCDTLLDELFEIDHVVRHSLTYDDSAANLQALCVACHRQKTQDEVYVSNPHFYEKAESNLAHDAHSRTKRDKSIEGDAREPQQLFSKYFHQQAGKAAQVGI